MSTKFKSHILPLSITVITFFVLTSFLYFFLHVLNLFPLRQKIHLILRPVDLAVGMIIYLKTSIDFVLFMGNLMHTNPGWKKRIAITLGTAIGNCLGTLVVLCIWYFLKEAPILLIIMIVLASFVLFEMAEEGLEEVTKKTRVYDQLLYFPIQLLKKINAIFKPILGKILPETGMKAPNLSFPKLFFFSLTIPFILGLDDFAGYIPLFSIVNVMSFITGVFLAHMLVNVGLFSFPHFTTKVTQHPLVVILGSIAFVGIGTWGLYEAIQIVVHLIPH